MSDVTADSIQKEVPIEHKLRQAWRGERRFVHLRGLSRFVIWAVAMLVVDFVIDWGIFFKTRMPDTTAALLLLINVVVLAWVLWHEWLRHLKRFDPLIVALEVEQQHPELASMLVSYTQLDGLTTKQPNVSPELIQAMREQAILRAQPLDFRKIVDFGQLRRVLLVAGCMLLFFSAASIRWRDYSEMLFARLAGIGGEYPTLTVIDEDSIDDIIVRVGDSAEVTVEASKKMPPSGWIYVKPADSSTGWKRLPIYKSPNGPIFSRELKNMQKDSVFYVRIGDDQSQQHQIRVVPAPKITATQVTLTFPEYMKQEAINSDQLSQELPALTQMWFRLSCDATIERVVVKTDRAAANADLINTAMDRLLPDPAPEEPLTKEQLQQIITEEVARLIAAADGPIVIDGLPDDDPKKKFVESRRALIEEVPPRLVALIADVRDEEKKREIIEQGLGRLFDEVEATVDGDVFFGAWANESFKYDFHWTVNDSGKQFEYEDVKHSVRVVPDYVPEIELIRPGSNGLATDKKKVQLLARAADDHGLSQAWLVYSTDPSEEHRIPIRDFEGLVTAEFSYEWELKKDIPDLEPGVEVSFRIEVVDRHPDAVGHTHSSATRRFRIVEPDVYLQWFRAELAAQRDEIKRAKDAEETSSEKVKQIKKQEGEEDDEP